MLIPSLKFTVRPESLGPNSQLCVPFYSHSLDAVVPSNWFPYIDAARTRIAENMSRDRYAARPLARWLLPSNCLGMNLQENASRDGYHCCVVTSLRVRKLCEQKKNTAAVLLAMCVAGVA
jgi:hypothetical protein